MKGCLNCTHYSSELNYNNEGKFESIKSCSKGNTTEMNTWWDNNGHKRDNLDEVICFEQTEMSKKLDEMIGLTDEILKKLK